MTRLIFPFLLSIFALNAYAQPTDKRLAGLEAYVNKVLKDHHAAGCAVVIVEKNKVLYKGGFGYRDVEKKLPATANTLYAIGSSTKAFTCTLIGQLADDKKIDIDQPATAYLPGLRFNDNELTANVTPRDMMCHRTGLPRHDYAWIGNTTTPMDSLVYRIRFFEASAPLRTSWQYNNFMFTSLGAMAAQVSGKNWHQLLQEKIFAPLGMSSTNSAIKGLTGAADHALPYTIKNDSVLAPAEFMALDNMGPAGSINSNANDMAAWLMAWINDGKYKEKQVIPADYRAQAMTAQMSMGGLVSKKQPDVFFANYGFGWMLASYKGHYRVEHGGNVTGFTSSVCFFPTDSIGIAVFVNQNGSQVNSVIRNYLCDKLMGLSFTDWNAKMLERMKKATGDAAAKLKTEDSLRVKGTNPSHALADYVGTYANDGYGNAVVSMENDSLILTVNGYRMKLRHHHYDIFKAMAEDDTYDDGEGMLLRFGINYRGEIETLGNSAIEPSVKEIIFKKQVTAIAVADADLKKYAGNYELSGVTINVYIKNGNTLMIKVPGQPDYEGVPVKPHEFAMKELDGYSVRFDVNDKNEVSAINFIQPNGVFKAKKK